MTILKKISQKINNFVSKVILLLIYYLGIGTTSLVSKIAGKIFLNLTPQKSNWETPTGSNKKEKMY